MFPRQSVLLCMTVVFCCAILSFSSSANTALTSGKRYLERGDLDNAREQFEKAVQEVPQNWEAHFLLGVVYGREMMFDRMNSEFEEVLKLDSRKKDVINRGDRKYWAGREPLWIEWYNNGRMHFDNQNYDKAMEFFEGAMEIWPSVRAGDKIFSQMSYAYSMLGKRDEAIGAANKCFELEPEYSRVNCLLAKTYINLHICEEASKIYDNMRNSNISAGSSIEELEFLMSLAQCHKSTGNHDEAIIAYGKVIDIVEEARTLKVTGSEAVGTSTYVVHITSGRAFVENGLIVNEDILKWAKRMQVNYNMGVLCSQAGHYDKAIPHFQRALEIDSTDIDVMYNLGLVYFKMEKYLEAIRQFEQIIKMDSTYVDGWESLSKSYSKIGEVQRSEEASERARTLKDAASKESPQK